MANGARSLGSPWARALVSALIVAAAGACSKDREEPADTGERIHPRGFADPHSADYHGNVLRGRRWAPMLDPTADDACGRCHEGIARPEGITMAAPGAPSCTSCHDRPGGVLACETCHGNGDRAYPPRDPNLFPGDAAKAGAHAAHAEPRATHAMPFDCATCHPMPGPEVIGGTHGNGSVEIVFGGFSGEASYDRSTKSCAVYCHDRGGTMARPTWAAVGGLDCNSCHLSPPANHYPGPCTTCHREADAHGTALSGGPLHLNGTVDLGDASGKCGACHGKGDDPWPATNAHPSHESPVLTTPIDCASCHPTHSDIHDPGHMDGVVEIQFAGRALDRGQSPTWDGMRCVNVACHGAGLPEPVAAPVWKDATGAAKACGACHGTPPTEQHTASSSCERSDCHGAEVARGSGAGLDLKITDFGKPLHVDGVIEFATH